MNLRMNFILAEGRARSYEGREKRETPSAKGRVLTSYISMNKTKASWVGGTGLKFPNPAQSCMNRMGSPSLPSPSPERFTEKAPNSPSPAGIVTPTERRFN
jgi:hypothetical protein